MSALPNLEIERLGIKLGFLGFAIIIFDVLYNMLPNGGWRYIGSWDKAVILLGLYLVLYSISNKLMVKNLYYMMKRSKYFIPDIIVLSIFLKGMIIYSAFFTGDLSAEMNHVLDHINTNIPYSHNIATNEWEIIFLSNHTFYPKNNYFTQNRDVDLVIVGDYGSRHQLYPEVKTNAYNLTKEFSSYKI